MVALVLLLTAVGQSVSCEIPAGKQLTLAAGPPESTAACVARAFASVFDEANPDYRTSVLGTNGAVDSLEAVREGRADLAITTADTLGQAVNGEGAFQDRTVPARTLATLYTSPVYLIAAADSTLTGLSRLRDITVGVGPPGSGMELTAGRVLSAARLERHVTMAALAWDELLERFRRGGLPAFFWVDGSPSPAIAQAAGAREKGLRLLNTASVVPLLQQRYGHTLYTSSGQILGPAFDSNRAVVVAVSTILVSRQDLSRGAAFSVTSELFRLSESVVRTCPAAAGLSSRTGAQPQPAALHPGAALFFRQSDR